MTVFSKPIGLECWSQIGEHWIADYESHLVMIFSISVVFLPMFDFKITMEKSNYWKKHLSVNICWFIFT